MEGQWPQGDAGSSRNLLGGGRGLREAPQETAGGCGKLTKPPRRWALSLVPPPPRHSPHPFQECKVPGSEGGTTALSWRHRRRCPESPEVTRWVRAGHHHVCTESSGGTRPHASLHAVSKAASVLECIVATEATRPTKVEIFTA